MLEDRVFFFSAALCLCPRSGVQWWLHGGVCGFRASRGGGGCLYSLPLLRGLRPPAPPAIAGSEAAKARARVQMKGNAGKEVAVCGGNGWHDRTRGDSGGWSCLFCLLHGCRYGLDSHRRDALSRVSGGPCVTAREREGGSPPSVFWSFLSEDKKDSLVPPAGDVFPPSADGEIPCRAKGAAFNQSAAAGGTSPAVFRRRVFAAQRVKWVKKRRRTCGAESKTSAERGAAQKRGEKRRKDQWHPGQVRQSWVQFSEEALSALTSSAPIYDEMVMLTAVMSRLRSSSALEYAFMSGSSMISL